jgi:hypothetical protein
VPDDPIQNEKPSLLQLVWSMIAAFAGIQSNQNHDRDDAYIEKVGFTPYIIIGVVLTALCVLGIYLIVTLVLAAT